MEVQDLGLIPYEEALRIQERAVSTVIERGPGSEMVIVCEHPPVITVGRAHGAGQEVFARDLPVFEIARGGRATLHMPGQIVVYPVVDLKGRGKDLHAHMRMLETAIIETLADFRVHGRAAPGKTGVWVGEKKIASIGIAVKHWVTYHGLALNVSCDLSLFSKINPCGFSPGVMTSLLLEMSDEYKRVWNVEEVSLLKKVKKRLIENLDENLRAAGSSHVS